MFRLTLAILMVAIVSISSCGKRKTTDVKRELPVNPDESPRPDVPPPVEPNAPKPSPAVTPTPTPRPDTGQTVTRPELAGQWISSCLHKTISDQIDGIAITRHEYRSVAVTVGGAALKATVRVGSRAECASSAYVIDIESSYQLGDQPSLQPDIFPIDHTLTSIHLTYLDPNEVADLIDIGFCGYRDWQVNKPKDVTGKKCFEDEPAFPGAGHKGYDIVRRNADQLVFGLSFDEEVRKKQERDGSTPEKRPITLHTQEALRRTP